jgi:sulfatase maturation enzyme AslB (radical SAM superfamily)
MSLPEGFGLILKYKFTNQVGTFSAAIDVTSACNLRCAHCYLYRNENFPYEFNKMQQMSDEEWIARIERLKKEHPHLIHATWVGGEPLMRRELLRKGAKLFDFNWVVTNGTMPIPDDFDNTTFVVSLDGPEEYHDQIRGKGVYAKARDNIMKANTNVYAHCVINRKNKNSIEQLISEWYSTKLEGIRFSFHTPDWDVEDPLWLPPEERDEVVGQLFVLRNKYKNFIWMTEPELEALKSENQLRVFGNNCLLKRGADVALDNKGNVKTPCVMGMKADCNRCGCTIPAMLYAIGEKVHVPTMLNIASTFVK